MYSQRVPSIKTERILASTMSAVVYSTVSTYMCVVFVDHNRTHAADVLHAVSYLLFEIIPEFSHEFINDSHERERKVPYMYISDSHCLCLWCSASVNVFFV